jgi:AraC family transcriptional regulator
MRNQSTFTSGSSTKPADSFQKEQFSEVYSRTMQQWENILVEEIQALPGQEQYESLTTHTICVSLNSTPSHLLQVVGDRQHNSPCTRGDICIVPAGHPFFWQWQRNDHYVRIQIDSQCFDRLVREGKNLNVDCTRLLPKFRVRHLQVEQISLMLLDELKNGGSAGHLYVDALTNALSVQLLRNFSALKPQITSCEGGLSDRQIRQIADYIHENLAQEIKIAELAELTRMSHFYFSRLFKQAIGVSPHQYVIQQRLERAKHLLKTTELPVMEVAISCGFSSHSHLGKLIRQHTGLSPKAYRISQGT